MALLARVARCVLICRCRVFQRSGGGKNSGGSATKMEARQVCVTVKVDSKENRFRMVCFGEGRRIERFVGKKEDLEGCEKKARRLTERASVCAAKTLLC